MRMRLHKCLKYITTVVTTAVLTMSMILPAMAATPTGTLTIRPKYGDKVLDAGDYNGTFQVYHIADYSETGEFTVDEDLEELEVSFDQETLADDEAFKELTQSVAEYVKDHKSDIDPIHKGIKVDESLTLAYGVYLITSDTLADGYLDFEPFLAMIPEFSDNTTNTNVVAYPKVSKEPSNPDEPHKPHEPGTPSNPPTNPPTPIEENGEIIEPAPEIGIIEEAGAFTGDASHMMLYGVIAVAAVAVLVVWYARKRRTESR